MRSRWGIVPLLVLLGTFGIAVSSAAATTYCVNTTATDCDPVALPDVQAALDAAGLNAGHDVVRIGPGTYTSGPTGFSGDDVDLVGAGTSTVLTSPAAGGVRVLKLTGTSAVSTLKINIPAGDSNIGLRSAKGKVQDVTVAAPAGATNAIGIQSTASGTLELDGAIVTAPGAGSTGLEASIGDLTVHDSSFTAATGIIASASETLKVSGAFITATNVGILGAGGFMSLENALIGLTGVNTRGIVVPGSLPSLGLANGTLDGRNLTIIGTGGAGSVGIDVTGTAGVVGVGRNADARVSSTVIRGTAISFRRKGDAPVPGEIGGDAKLTVKYSLFGAALDQSGPGGDADVATENIPGNPDPLFANPQAADFTPKAGSPLLDAGDPRALLPGESAVDIAGRPRVANGRVDIGAYEYQPVATPTPPDKVGPKLKIVTSSARLTRSGKLQIKVTCPKTETRGCKGNVAAASAKKLKLTKKSKSRILSLGKSNFNTIAAGKSKVVTIKVGKTARGVIKKRKKLSVKITVSARDRAKNLGKASRTITVRPAK